NTKIGIFKNDGPYDNYIVTTGVKSLYEITYKPHFVVGANVSLTQCIEAFNHAAQNYKGFKHMAEVAKHWENVANTGVRNLRCYKISARAVNSKAFLNACFKFHLNSKDKMKVTNIPTIVIGGVNSSFVRASKTEKSLLGKLLSNPEDVKKAIETLGQEVEPDAILSILGNSASSDVQSGGTKLERPISTSKQNFDANKEAWPVGQPVEKLESRIQISGEAEYLDDIPDLPGELYGSFVQSERATGKIKSIDASKCLVFADEELKYHGQAIGVVVAETRELAKAAAKLVEVSYEEGGKPILTIKQAMETEDKYHKAPDFTGSTQALEFGNVEREISFGSQYHFTMEPIAARTVPTEEGYDVWCTTQWPTETQNVVATVLDIPANRINISVRRIGGAYGCKISRSNLVAAASAIAAHKLKKPVRIALDIETQMTLVGWREPYYSKYKVGFDTKGILSAVSVDICSDVGLVANENSSFVAAHAIPNVYYCPNWKIQSYYAQTNTPTNTWCRTPEQQVEKERTILDPNVAQVVAKTLRVPLDLITVKPTDNFVAANSAVTGGSFGSDVNAHGAKICSERLRNRIDEVAKKNKIKRSPNTWTELVKKCFAEQVDLTERYCTFANEHPKVMIFGGLLY
ncbi:hypothetical protein Anas_02025, partial [Armadillidium nasatum]